MACVILFTKTGEIKFWKCKSSPGRNKIDVTVEHSTPGSMETQGLIHSSDAPQNVGETTLVGSADLQPDCMHVHESK
jgi:hypothetical protein